MRINLYIIILLFSGLKLSAFDQRFYNINDIFGVSIREVFSVCKDNKDFIWGASKTGILRISGKDLRVYQLHGSTPDNYFTRLVCEDSLLVAYTNNGQFFIYDELYDCFTLLVDMRQRLKNNFINLNGVVLDSNGKLWISCTDGLYMFDNGNLKPILAEMRMQHAGLHDHTRIFVATPEGIGLLDKNTYRIEYISKYKINNEFEVSSYLYDRSTGLFWIGTVSNKLLCYKKEGEKFAEVSIVNLPEQPILAIKKNTSALFVGVDGQGLWKLTEDGQKILTVYKEDVNDPYSLDGDGVYDVLIDDEERIWVATFTGGLSYMEQNLHSVTQITHQINQPNSLINNCVNKVLEDGKGDIWFATNNGISRWNRDENKWYAYLQNKHDQAKVFLALCEDNRGNIWAGTYSSGVYLLDGETGKVIGHFFDKEDGNTPGGVSGKFISDLYRDSQGNIWMGGTRNVICYTEKEKQFRIYEQQPIYAFGELSLKKMLIGCTYGLISLDKAAGDTEILFDNILARDMVIVGNDIWVATSGAGLIRYDYANRTIEKYTTQSGLLSNYINSILQEGDNLWLGTESGLCRYSLTDSMAYTYSNTHPLSAISFNTNSCWSLKNGNLIWGTNKGAIMFKPDMLGQNIAKSKIFFQDISVSGSSIRTNDDLLNDIPVNKRKNLKLNYKQNNFVLELISTGMYNANTRFSWKMEGIDNDWSQPSDLRFITHTNLPSGNFELKIKMYDSTLSQLIDERTLDITVVPPFWQTVWFRLLVVLTVASVIIYSLRLYSNNLKQKHARDKIRFFTNMAHDLRTSLTLISAPIERLKNAAELADKSRYYLDLAADQSERLSLVATQLLDFEKVDSGKGQLFPVMTDVVKLVSNRKQIFETTADKKEIVLEFHSDRETYVTAVDEIKVEKIVDNLISNAIKYSHRQSRVEIFLNCAETQWSLEVKDYGLGISENAKNKLFKEFYRGDNKANSRMVGSGIGLLLVKSYVTMHDGKIVFESKENVGSSFKIVIPYCRTSDVNMPAQVHDISSHTVPHRAADTDRHTAVSEENDKDKSMHILVVEDNADLREFLVNTLAEHYKVSKAGDGMEAWKLTGKITPDLIVSDVMMPGMDGFELCTKIKSTFETSHVPVILLTSLSQKAKQLEGLGLGADDYITKPFDISLLKQRIRSIIRNREVVRQKALKMINQKQDDEPVYANELNDLFVKRAIELVNKNISNCEFGKDEFASAMNASPSLLYQKLKALTGQSPIDFIRAIRFNHAMELLQTHKYTITEVSEMCGFSSANYFSTAFKKHFGKPPMKVQNN